MANLTAETIRKAKAEPGKRLELRDDIEPGLVLRVTDDGRKSWSIRYRAAGSQRRKTIGPFPAIGIARAREEAKKLKGVIAGGVDVVALEKASRAEEARKRLRTLGGLAEAYFADAELGLHRPNAKGPKRPGTIALDKGIFKRLIKPEFGKVPVADMRRADIQAFVTRLSKDTPSNGRLAHAVIRQILAYALWKDLVEHNAATAIGVIKSKPRERVLSDDELRAIWRACEYPGAVEGLKMSLDMGIALRLAMVTLQRGGEVIGAEWREINRRARTWTIPAERMKGGKTHLVPLNDLAIALLDEAKDLIRGERFVFESRLGPEQHIDRQAFTRAMTRIVEALKIPRASPHDFRRTGATNLTSERVGIPRFVVSQVIAHSTDFGGAAAVTGRHYDLNDYLPEKRRALDAWGALLAEIVSGKARASNVTTANFTERSIANDDQRRARIPRREGEDDCPLRVC